MKSDLPKVMHRLAGRTMIRHVLDSVGVADTGAHHRRAGARAWTTIVPEVGRRGDRPSSRSRSATGHAALAALPALQDLLAANGHRRRSSCCSATRPLLTTPTLAALLAERRGQSAGVGSSFSACRPRRSRRLWQADLRTRTACSRRSSKPMTRPPSRRAIGLCNSGRDGDRPPSISRPLLAAIGTEQRQGANTT